ncbi:MAG: GNAT family N-acetyltransferase [Pseudomonadota bacterium]
MTDITIEKIDHDHGGKFVAHVAGETAVGELSYSRVTDELIIANHTGVPEELAGKGVAKALANHLIQDARESGYRIVPLCPYVRAQSLKHPEWDDVIVRK